jgi:hypothetical protein
VPSVSRQASRACLLVVCALFLIGVASGCTTTQETAELKQAQSKRILERRDHKQKHRRAERAKGRKG